ncbi:MULTISPECIES: Kazal-type serine protease inhibitor domain-containing protein [Mesorhizobium]|uniref:Protease inhibitor n=1 Tax=Mesorhizobium denitrificans TaxID=2294114 RepID=A0A371XEQ3_9HYPH|nr:MULTISPECIES: Kazal-type serine protease inhibitor domain-containing protein [Mesorhizobium]RFC67514.1 protease inhibitor [Mesorhizobium denitrificans]
MTNPFKTNVGRWAVLILSGLMLASCVVETVPRPGPPRPMPPAGPVMCTREYAPVCGRRGGDFRTFGNSCMARADGYRVVDRGPCRTAPPPMRPPRPRPEPAPAMCPMIYAPVCAGRGGMARTFGNECQARAQGFRVLQAGPC